MEAKMLTETDQSEISGLEDLNEHQREEFEYLCTRIDSEFARIEDNTYRTALIKVATKYAKVAVTCTSEKSLQEHHRFFRLLDNMPGRASLFKTEQNLRSYIYDRSRDNATRPLVAKEDHNVDHFLLLAGAIYERTLLNDRFPSREMDKAIDGIFDLDLFE